MQFIQSGVSPRHAIYSVWGQPQTSKMDLWDQVYIMSYLVPEDQIGTLGLSPNHSISTVWGQPQRSIMDLWDQVYIMSYLVPEDQIETLGLSLFTTIIVDSNFSTLGLVPIRSWLHIITIKPKLNREIQTAVTIDISCHGLASTLSKYQY